MEGFSLDSNTVKDCAEPPAAVAAWNRQIYAHHAPSVKPGMAKIFTDSEERVDSAYGSECCSSFASALARSGDVSERLQGLSIDHQSSLGQPSLKGNANLSQIIDCEGRERLSARPQKRSAEELEDNIVLTHDAYDQDEEGDTPLAQAIIHESSGSALKFIRYTTDPSLFNSRNCLGQTPLMLSVMTSQPKVCRALVVAGASLDIQDPHGNTALHLACQRRNTECVQALTTRVNPIEVKNTLRSGMQREHPNLTQQFRLKNYDGLTCIHLATLMNNVRLLKYLTALGADVNEPDGKSGRTALHYAVEMNEFNLVQELIANLNANVDAVTFDRCTPLHLAAGRGHENITYLLLGASADTQVQNFEGQFAYNLTDNAELMSMMEPQQQPDYTNLVY
ncbi:NF-kappa-B inhibitor alpha-like [Diadema antillarum]|uniref:NF-kappa-B inhibitor alpha-like n=1 Tax=Diadema antillarum TaxID=105358 RepID=UPI003A8B91E6